MQDLLRRIFGTKQKPDFTALADRVTALERAEAERERATTEQLVQLQKYWKRIRTREGREKEFESDPVDDLSRQILALKMRNVGKVG
jgi:hypothetical protein